jgi:hypothetical protein
LFRISFGSAAILTEVSVVSSARPFEHRVSIETATELEGARNGAIDLHSGGVRFDYAGPRTVLSVIFRGFTQSFQANIETLTSNRPGCFHSHSLLFIIH